VTLSRRKKGEVCGRCTSVWGGGGRYVLAARERKEGKKAELFVKSGREGRGVEALSLAKRIFYSTLIHARAEGGGRRTCANPPPSPKGEGKVSAAS